MITKTPIRFDRIITIEYNDGSTEQSQVFPTSRGLIACTFEKINGYDANNARVTNLVGYNSNSLIKKCPSCERDLPTISYGASGRVTVSQRDQSQCSSCRSN